MLATTAKAIQCFPAILLCWLGTASALHAQSTSRADIQNAWEIYRILQRSCSECHGGHLSKPKSDFGYILDLPRLVTEREYVTPGDPDRSELYRSLIDEDPDYRMPPPDSEAPPLSEEEIGAVRRWIENGANSGFPMARVAANDTDVHETPRATRIPAAVRQPGRLHPALVHFPIALLLAALFAEAFSTAHPRRKTLHGATRVCLWIGAAGAIVAVVTGWLMAAEQGYAPTTVQGHRWIGVATATLATLCLFAFELARFTDRKWALWLMRFLLLSAAALAAAAGHTGGELVYGPDWFL